MRLIDADAPKEQVCLDGDCTQCKTGVNEKLCKWNMVQLNDVMKCLEDAPTIDAVPVVRCKDCKYWNKDTLRHNSNDVAEWDECECEMLANRDRWNEIDRYCCDIHFCADGERKDND